MLFLRFCLAHSLQDVAAGDSAIGAHVIGPRFRHLAEHRAADLHRVLEVLRLDAPGAIVPGAPFYAHAPDSRTMRLSFVTLSPADIERGVTLLGQVLHEALSTLPVTTP